MKLLPRILLSVSAFLLVAAVFCFLAWCGGFNFDQRTPKVSEIAFYAIVFASVASGAAFFASK